MRRDSRAACASTHGNDGWDCVAQWDDHRTRCDPSCLGRRIAEANILVLDDIPGGGGLAAQEGAALPCCSYLRRHSVIAGDGERLIA